MVFALPLMFAGGSFLGSLAQQQTVGAVGDLDIPRGEFNAYFQRYAEQYRQAYGVDDITREMAAQINERVQQDLGARYLMQASIRGFGVLAPDAEVARRIREEPEFADDDGNFDFAVYEETVVNRRYYEEQLRDDIGRQPLLLAMDAYVPPFLREAAAKFRRQRRVIDEAVLPVSAIADLTLQISPEDINLYYQRNRADYAVREEGEFEYFILESSSFIDPDLATDEDALLELYDERLLQDTLFERRRLSHIYLTDEATADEVYELAAATDSSEAFGDLAAEYSEDFGSAQSGGDLGIVVDGDLPEAFNSVLFTLLVGQVAAPVAVDGGFSIMRLDEIVGGETPDLEDIRDELEAQYRANAALDDFEIRAEELNELAPLELGSLVSMAAVAEVSVSVAATVWRDAADNAFPFNDALALDDVFDSLVVGDGENSLGIPLGAAGDAYLYVRARGYQPPSARPLEQVALGIEDILKAQRVIDIMSADESVSDTLLENVTWRTRYTVVLAGDEEELTAGQAAAAAAADAEDAAAAAAAAAAEAAAAEDESAGESAAGDETAMADEDAADASTDAADESAADDAADESTADDAADESTAGDATDESTDATDESATGDATDESATDDAADDATDESAADESAAGEEGAGTELAVDEAEEIIDDATRDLIFTADLSGGLPSYVYEAEEEGIRIFRIVDIVESEPELQDYEVVDELIEQLGDRIAYFAYLNGLTRQYDIQFHNLPQVDGGGF